MPPKTTQVLQPCQPTSAERLQECRGHTVSHLVSLALACDPLSCATQGGDPKGTGESSESWLRAVQAGGAGSSCVSGSVVVGCSLQEFLGLPQGVEGQQVSSLAEDGLCVATSLWAPSWSWCGVVLWLGLSGPSGSWLIT